MKKLGVNVCINWGLIWEVGVGEGLGMRDSAVIDFPNPDASAVRNTYCLYSRIIIYVWLKTSLHTLHSCKTFSCYKLARFRQKSSSTRTTTQFRVLQSAFVYGWAHFN